jgi:hypothetical protein
MRPNHICNYAVLRFLPYPETGEFVNVGVVLHDADTGWCGHAGDEQDVKRVTQFFPTVAAEEYLRHRAAMFAELERVGALIQVTPDQRVAKSIFQELVRPRESVFRFGEMRTAATDDPAELLQRLCEQHVKAKRTAAKLAAA